MRKAKQPLNLTYLARTVAAQELTAVTPWLGGNWGSRLQFKESFRNALATKLPVPPGSLSKDRVMIDDVVAQHYTDGALGLQVNFWFAE